MAMNYQLDDARIGREMEETYTVRKMLWGLLKTTRLKSATRVGDHIIVDCGPYKPSSLTLLVDGYKYDVSLDSIKVD